ncbi:MAG: crossover junction endodeoxyribonuclease RuvC [Acutalibacteraceae bacterium]
MIIMGLDPGYAIVGYGIVSYEANRFKALDFGAVTTDKDTDFSERLKQIYDGVTYLLQKWKPCAMSVEKLFFNTNTTTAIGVAQARGVCLLSAYENKAELFEYTPLQVKQAVTGYGRADKRQMQEMTRMLLGLDSVPKPDDTADALAMAICHAHSAGSIASAIKRNIR